MAAVALLVLSACAGAAPLADAPATPTADPAAAPVTPSPSPTPPPTPSPPPSPSPTPLPTPPPTPSPSPTPNVEELAQMFLVVADNYNAAVCAENQILERASDAELYEVATASFGRGVVDIEIFVQGVDSLGFSSTQFMPAYEQLRTAALAVAEVYGAMAAASDLDELFDIYDAQVADVERNMNEASRNLREQLGLPARPADPCERET